QTAVDAMTQQQRLAGVYAGVCFPLCVVRGLCMFSLCCFASSVVHRRCAVCRYKATCVYNGSVMRRVLSRVYREVVDVHISFSVDRDVRHGACVCVCACFCALSCTLPVCVRHNAVLNDNRRFCLFWLLAWQSTTFMYLCADVRLREFTI